MIIDGLNSGESFFRKVCTFSKDEWKVENYYYYIDNEISGVSAADIISCTMNSL